MLLANLATLLSFKKIVPQSIIVATLEFYNPSSTLQGKKSSSYPFFLMNSATCHQRYFWDEKTTFSGYCKPSLACYFYKKMVTFVA